MNVDTDDNLNEDVDEIIWERTSCKIKRTFLRNKLGMNVDTDDNLDEDVGEIIWERKEIIWERTSCKMWQIFGRALMPDSLS